MTAYSDYIPPSVYAPPLATSFFALYGLYKLSSTSSFTGHSWGANGSLLFAHRRRCQPLRRPLRLLPPSVGTTGQSTSWRGGSRCVTRTTDWALAERGRAPHREQNVEDGSLYDEVGLYPARQDRVTTNTGGHCTEARAQCRPSNEDGYRLGGAVLCTIAAVRS